MKALAVIFAILAVVAAIPRAYFNEAPSKKPTISSLGALAGAVVKNGGDQDVADKQSPWFHLGGISTIKCYQSFVQINPGLNYVDTMLGENNLELEVSCKQHPGMWMECTRVTLRVEGKHDTFVDLCDESTGIFGRKRFLHNCSSPLLCIV